MIHWLDLNSEDVFGTADSFYWARRANLPLVR
jgi:hypothetical protein